MVKVWQYVKNMSRIRRCSIETQIVNISFFWSKQSVSILAVSPSYNNLLTWFELRRKDISNNYNFYFKCFSWFGGLVTQNRLGSQARKERKNLVLSWTGPAFPVNLQTFPGPVELFLDRFNPKIFINLKPNWFV